MNVASRTLAFLEGRSRRSLLLASLGLVTVLGVVDYLTGPEASFGIFYLLPVSLSAYFAGRAGGLAMSILCALTWLAADLIDQHRFSIPLMPYWNAFTRLLFYLSMTAALSALRKAYEQQRELARADFLTGAANFRAFSELAARELARARRSGRPFSLAHIDVDGFKGVNDSLGHQAGDELLVAIADTLRRQSRSTDLVARLGGDEFAILLPDTPREQAALVIPKLREKLDARVRKGGWAVTFSMGLVTCEGGSATVEELLGKADALTYRAKRAGKNRIEQDEKAGPAYTAPQVARSADKGR